MLGNHCNDLGESLRSFSEIIAMIFFNGGEEEAKTMFLGVIYIKYVLAENGYIEQNDRAVRVLFCIMIFGFRC